MRSKRALAAALGLGALGLLACDVDVHTDRETAREAEQAESTLEGTGREIDESAREAGRDIGEGIERAGEKMEETFGGSGDEPMDETPDTPARNSQ